MEALSINMLMRTPTFLGSGSSSLLNSVKFALLPIAKVLIMCAVGFLLATRRIGILSSNGNKLLSKLVFTLFLPSLIFTELGSAITFEKILQWWFIPVNVLLAAFLGSLVGCIVVLIVRPPTEFVKFTIIMIGIGNIGNIPLVLLSAVCGDSSNPFGDSTTCNENGVAYISFGQWVGAVIVYTYVYYMMSPESDLPYSSIDYSSSLNQRLIKDGENGANGDGIPWWKRKVAQTVEVAKSLQLHHIFQPPVTASILALVVGSIPFLKKLFFPDDAPLLFLTDCLGLFGDAMIPCILLGLGGNLHGGPGSSRLSAKLTAVITFTRLIIIPPIGIGVVTLADKLGFLPEDDALFRFVLLLQHSMPSSILAGGVSALRGVAVRESAAVLFWEHIFAVFSITLWLIVDLNLLF